MKSHFAWRPHMDRDTLFNPFVPSDHARPLGTARLSDAYGEDTTTSEEETSQPGAEVVSDKEPEPPKPAE